MLPGQPNALIMPSRNAQRLMAASSRPEAQPATLRRPDRAAPAAASSLVAICGRRNDPSFATVAITWRLRAPVDAAPKVARGLVANSVPLQSAARSIGSHRYLPAPNHHDQIDDWRQRLAPKPRVA